MKRLLALAGVSIALWAGVKTTSGHRPGPKFLAVAQHVEAEHLRILEGPKVDYVSAHHAVVSWTTNASASSSLRLGTSRNELNRIERSRWSRKQHRIELSKLKAETKYYYQVVSADRGGKVESEVATFTTNRKGERPTRFPEGR